MICIEPQALEYMYLQTLLILSSSSIIAVFLKRTTLQIILHSGTKVVLGWGYDRKIVPGNGQSTTIPNKQFIFKSWLLQLVFHVQTACHSQYTKLIYVAS